MNLFVAWIISYKMKLFSTATTYNNFKEEMGTVSTNRDTILGAGLVLCLLLIFGLFWYFQSSLNLLQEQGDHDRRLLLKLQDQVKV